jgi:hypothetical protein
MSAGTITIRHGVGMLSVFSNIVYASLRAQDQHPVTRKILFVIGMPWSIITLLAVDLGSEKAYGVHLPKIKTKMNNT